MTPCIKSLVSKFEQLIKKWAGNSFKQERVNEKNYYYLPIKISTIYNYNIPNYTINLNIYSII